MEKLIIISIFSFIFTFFGTKLLKDFFIKKKIYDYPNQRSSHTKPVPTSGGLIIYFCIITIILILDPYDKIPALITITGLAVLSWKDDLKNLNILVRLFFQIFFISIYFFYLYSINFYQQIPLINIFFIILIFTWFINIFNFMDGIDGISSLMTITICLGIVFAYLLNNSEYFPSFEIIIISICLAFLFWNWYPAKIFLGDIGSITLGFVCALSLYWLLLDKNSWHWVLSLPMYYFLDTTVTLIKRFIEKKKIWKAHKEHFYQKAVQSGMKHSKVVFLISILQVIIILTCYLVKNPYLVVFLAFIESLMLLIYFSSKYKKST